MKITPADSEKEITALRALIADQAEKLGQQKLAFNVEVEKRDAIISNWVCSGMGSMVPHRRR